MDVAKTTACNPETGSAASIRLMQRFRGKKKNGVQTDNWLYESIWIHHQMKYEIKVKTLLHIWSMLYLFVTYYIAIYYK